MKLTLNKLFKRGSSSRKEKSNEENIILDVPVVENEVKIT